MHTQAIGHIVRSALLAISALTAGFASADTITWTGAAGDGLWATKGNWNLGRIPIPATDDIVLPDSATPYAVTNTTAYTYKIGLTVGKNATLCIACNHATVLFDSGCHVLVKDGGTIDSWQPNGGLTIDFALGSCLEMEPHSVFTNRSSYAGTVNMGPDWKLKGGIYLFKKKLCFANGATIAGTDVEVGGYNNISPYDKTQAHVLHGRSGSLMFDHTSWTGSRPWDPADYPGSYINFTPYSTFKLIFSGAYNNKKWCYNNFFNGETARGRYDNRCLTYEEFDELFEVSNHPTRTATVVELKPQSADSIIVTENAVLNTTYDAKAHAALDIVVTYPLADYTLEYSVDDSGIWSTTVPQLTAAGAYTIHARVTDLNGVLETWTKDYTATIAARPLENNATIAAIDECTETGAAIEPEPVVTDTLNSQAVTLVRDTDYTVAYADNVNPGVATVTVTGTGNYTGALQTTFRINPKAFVGDVYVDAAAAGGDGSSWEKAIRDVEVAGDLIHAGYAIHIRAGTYYLTRALVIDGKAGVSVIGDGANATVLKPAANMTDRLVNVTESPNFVLRGVTVKGATLEVENADANGAGLRLVNSAATVDSCRIDGNLAHTTGATASGTVRGGGIYAFGSALVVTNSIVRRNQLWAEAKSKSLAYGAGIYSEGAALIVVDSEVEQNIVLGIVGEDYIYGGGICFMGGASSDARLTMTLARSLVANNSLQNTVTSNWKMQNCGDGIYLGNYAVFECSDSTVADNGLAGEITYIYNGSPQYGSSGIIGNNVTCLMTNVVICGQNGKTYSFATSTKTLQDVTTADPGFGSHYACETCGYPSSCTIVGDVQRVVYVDPANGSDDAAGDAAHPLKTGAAAFARAADGELEEIHLGAGTYSATANGETLPWRMEAISGLKVVGDGAATTILDGESVARTVRALEVSNCGRIAISGLTVRNMTMTLSDSASPYYEGGTVRFKSCNAEVADCRFVNNTVTIVPMVSVGWLYAYGGAIGGFQSRLAVSGCTFATNTLAAGNASTSYAMAYGGAVGTDNKSELTIKDSTFLFNRVTSVQSYYPDGNGGEYGGAIAAMAASYGDNLLLVGNTLGSSGFGGAIYSQSTLSRWTRLTVARNGGAAFHGVGKVSDSVFGENAVDVSPCGAIDIALKPVVSNTLYRVVADMTDLGDNVAGEAAFDTTMHATAAAAAGKGATLVLAAEPIGATLYVDPAAEEGGDGSEDAPFQSLTAALAVATPHATIRLAAGAYAGETYPLDFTACRDVTVVGAANKASVFDCEGVAMPRFANLSGAVGVRISNLTIRNVTAQQTLVEAGAIFKCAKALGIELSDIDIADSVLSLSEAKSWKNVPGGMVSVTAGSGVLMRRVAFKDCTVCAANDNNATFCGGGVAAFGGGVAVLESSFDGLALGTELKSGQQPRGGAVFANAAAVVLRNSVFTDNTALNATGGSGAALHLCNYVDCYAENCLFTSNGGENESAIVASSHAYLTLANNVFYDEWKHLSADKSYATVTATHNAATPEAAPAGTDTRLTDKDAELVVLADGSWNTLFTGGTSAGLRLVRSDANPLLDAAATRVWMTAESVDHDGSPRLSAHFNRKLPLPDIGPYELLRNRGLLLIIR